MISVCGTERLNTELAVNVAYLLPASVCRHFLQPQFGAVVLLLFIPWTTAEDGGGGGWGVNACMRVCTHTNTRAHISVSKRASAFTLLSNCLAPHTPAKIP